MEKFLKDINQKCVKIEEEQERKNTDLIRDGCTTIIQQLRKDELFKFLFRSIPLKIKKADDEYDINVVLVLPEQLQLEGKMDTETYPGMARLNLGYRYSISGRPMFKKIMTTLCTVWELDCLKVNEWFESLLLKAFKTYPRGKCNSNEIGMVIKYGLAKTLIINKYIRLNLVPCFELNLDFKPLPNYNQHELIKNQDKYYLLVPKVSYNRIHKSPELYWRVSFPKQEKECLNNLDKLEAAVRLLKLIRDDRNHKILSSYFIQTVAMHHVKVIKSSERFASWTMSEIFLNLLETLIQFVTSRNMPFFWFEEFNLLENCNQIYLHDLERFLKTLKLKILQDPEYIKKYISLS